MNQKNILRIGILLFAIIGMATERFLFGFEHGLFSSVPYTLVISLGILTVIMVKSLLTSSTEMISKILSGSIVIVGWLYVVTNLLIINYLLIILGVGLLIINIKSSKKMS